MKAILTRDKKQYDKISPLFKGETFLLTPKGNSYLKESIKLLNDKKINTAIIIDENYIFTHLLKKNGSWLIKNDLTIKLMLMEKLDLKPNKKDLFYKKINFGVPTDDITFNKGNFLFEEKILEESLSILIDLFHRDSFIAALNDFEEKNGYFNFRKKIIKNISENKLKLFKQNLKNDKVDLPGIKNIKKYSEKENKTFINVKNTIIVMIEKGDDIEINSLTVGNDEVSNFYENKGFLMNFSNNLKNNEKRQITKKDLILSTLGFLAFIFLTTFTFTNIFNTETISLTIKMLFEKETFSEPWIYLLWINSITSIFYSFLVLYIISYLIKKKKPNFNAILTFFIASQIKMTAQFITGQEILGTILWGAYIVKNNDIRTSSLMGAVATISLIRGFSTLFIGIIFMIIGQLYLVNVFNFTNGYTNSDFIIFVFFSWIGMIWMVLDRFARSGLILFPPVHFIYNKIHLFTFLKNDKNISIALENNQMSYSSLKKSTKNIFKEKERMIRVFVIILGIVFLEALESLYIFNLIESFMFIQNNGYEKVMHFNFLELSGARFMITQVKNFPLINILPGNGIGFVEYFMSNIYEYIYIFSHKLDITESNILLANSFSQQATFVTRFFNSYLKFFFSLSITSIIILKSVFRRVSK